MADEARDILASAWVESLGKVLEAMTSMRPVVEPSVLEDASRPLPPEETWTWWSESVSLIPDPSLWIGGSEDAWNRLGRWILVSLGIEDATDEDIQSTCRDVVAQVASAFAGELAKRLGGAVSSGGANPAERPTRDCILVNLDLGLPANSQKIIFWTAFDSRLAQQFAPADEVPETESPMSDSIGELRFPVYVRLGNTPVQLADVYKWTVGSVIEIGRRITDPVDVIVGNRVVARGQVVVCNGHYGARITSIERNADSEAY